MTVGVSPRSTVLDSCVNADERLYGYHRLADPPIAVPHKEKWIIASQSNINSVLAENDMTLLTEEKPPEPYKG